MRTSINPDTRFSTGSEPSAVAGHTAPLYFLRPGAAGNDAVCDEPKLGSYEIHTAARKLRARAITRMLVSAIDAVVAGVRRFRDGYVRRRQARIAYDALRSLDDHTLRDLGFDRSELTSVAAEVTGDAVHTRIRALMMHATP